jgi:hypothetical protein
VMGRTVGREREMISPLPPTDSFSRFRSWARVFFSLRNLEKKVWECFFVFFLTF